MFDTNRISSVKSSISCTLAFITYAYTVRVVTVSMVVDIPALTLTRDHCTVCLQIRAGDVAGAEELVSTLGTGDVLKSKIDAVLVKQSLKESSSVTAPMQALDAGTSLLSVTWAVVLTAPVVAYGLLV
jgi:hypothetical protein